MARSARRNNSAVDDATGVRDGGDGTTGVDTGQRSAVDETNANAGSGGSEDNDTNKRTDGTESAGADPAAAAGAEPAAKTRKPRSDAGKPRGPRGETKSGKLFISAEQVVGYHAILAMMTRSNVFVLEPVEGAALADAINDVARHFDIKAALDGPRIAIGKLIIVAGSIYMPRLIAMRNAQRKPPTPEEEFMRAAENATTVNPVPPTANGNGGNMQWPGQ